MGVAPGGMRDPRDPRGRGGAAGAGGARARARARARAFAREYEFELLVAAGVAVCYFLARYAVVELGAEDRLWGGLASGRPAGAGGL